VVWTFKYAFRALAPATCTVKVPGEMNHRPKRVGVPPRCVPFGAITAVTCQPLGTINMKILPGDDSLVMVNVTVAADGGGGEPGGVGGEDGGGWLVVPGLTLDGAPVEPRGGDDAGGDGWAGDVGGRVGLVRGFDGAVVFVLVLGGVVAEPGTTGAETLTDPRWVCAASGEPAWWLPRLMAAAATPATTAIAATPAATPPGDDVAFFAVDWTTRLAASTAPVPVIAPAVA
jgi:hypothetical protein